AAATRLWRGRHPQDGRPQRHAPRRPRRQRGAGAGQERLSGGRAMTDPVLFRKRLLAREHLVGTFVKTPTTHATQILGALGYDFVVIDEEHAPFDRLATDAALLAARAVGTAALVRVRGSATDILSVLDCGATGVLVPHVATAARAREVVAACR